MRRWGAIPGSGASAGVEVRSLRELADLRRVTELFDSIWRPGQSGSLVTVELLRAMTYTGNYLAGAVDRAGTLVGASFGFVTAPPGITLHSHITGVADPARHRGVGLALKHHQRDWALARGLTEITWTYDPLVRRNAYFNLVKLGARPRAYLVDFYGDIGDSINAGQASDRLLVAWALAAPPPAAAADPAAEPAAEPAAGAVLVEVPADIEALRRSDPGLARQWRLAVREVLGGLLARGGRVTGFTRDGRYVVEEATGS